MDKAWVTQRTWVERAILALVLPGVAGAVNASGFFVVGSYTSHMTGQVARLGDELVQGHAHLVIEAASVILSFLLGAMIATSLVEVAKRKARARYVWPLALEVLTLMAFAVGAMGGYHAPGRVVLPSELGFAMGLQNAMVTRISGAVVRTTHLTGITTDIGIELVRAVTWFFDERRKLGKDIPRAFLVSNDPDLNKLRLHVAIFSSFLSGAVVGPALYLNIGPMALLLPASVLTVLMIWDVVFGLRTGGGDFEVVPMRVEPSDKPVSDTSQKVSKHIA